MLHFFEYRSKTYDKVTQYIVLRTTFSGRGIVSQDDSIQMIR